MDLPQEMRSLKAIMKMGTDLASTMGIDHEVFDYIGIDIIEKNLGDLNLMISHNIRIYIFLMNMFHHENSDTTDIVRASLGEDADIVHSIQDVFEKQHTVLYDMGLSMLGALVEQIVHDIARRENMMRYLAISAALR